MDRLLHAADRGDRDHPLGAERLEAPDVGAEVQLARRQPVAAAVARQEDHRPSLEGARAVLVGRVAERRAHAPPADVGDALQLVEPAAADDRRSPSPLTPPPGCPRSPTASPAAGHAHARQPSPQVVRSGEGHLDVVAGQPDQVAARAIARLQHEHVLRRAPPASRGSAGSGPRRPRRAARARDPRRVRASSRPGTRAPPPSPAAPSTGRRAGRRTAAPRPGGRAWRRSPPSVSPGKPTMTSAPRPSRGDRRGQTLDHAAVRPPPCTDGACARSTRSLPLCSGTWKCGAITGDVVERSRAARRVK